MIRWLLQVFRHRRPDPEHDLVVRRMSEQERRLRELVRDSYRRSEERLRGQR